MGNFVCGTGGIRPVSATFINKEGDELLSSDKSVRYVEFVSILMGDLVIDMYNDETTNESILSLRNPATLYNLYNKLKRRVTNNKYYRKASDGVKADLDLIENNWDLFVDYHLRYNGFINVTTDAEYQYSENDLDEANFEGEGELATEEKREEMYDREGNTESDWQFASDELRLLFRFIPKARFDAEEYIFTEELKEDGLPQQSNFLNVIKLIIDKTKGIRNADRFFELVNSKEMHNIVPELGILNRVLKFDDLGNLSSKQTRLLTDFFLLFSRPYNPVHSSRKIIKDTEHIHQWFRNTKGNKDKILANFIVSFQTKNLTQDDTRYIQEDRSTEEDGGRASSEYGYGKKRLIAVPRAFAPIVFELEDLEDMSMKEIEETYKEHLHFMKILGIEFSGKDLITKPEEKLAFIKVLNRASTMRNELEKRLQAGQYLFNPIQDTNYKFSYKDPSTKKWERIDTYKYFMEEAVEFESKFSRIAPSNIVKNAENENQNDITLPSAFTIALDGIMNAQNEEEFLQHPYFEFLDQRDPQYANSYIRRNVILHAEGAARIFLTAGNYNGYQLDSVRELRSSTKNLDARDKFINDFSNVLLYGAINTPQLERKSSYFFTQLQDSSGKGITPIRQTYISGRFTSNAIFLQQTLNYIHGEIMRVKTYPAKVGNQGGLNEFSQFKFMEKSLKPLVKLSEEQLSSLLNFNSKLSQSLVSDIEAYFSTRLRDYILYMRANKISAKELIPDRLISPLSQHSEESLDELRDTYLNSFLKAFIANKYIMDTEFMIFVGGNPVFVKDYHKRLGGVASTGIQPVTAEFLNDHLNYNAREKDFFDNFSLRGIMNATEGFDIQLKRDNSKTYLTAVIEEDISKSNAYTSPKLVMDYIASVKKKDGTELSVEEARRQLLVSSVENDGVKIGDGEGYINLDFHRELAIRQGIHREEHDVSYILEGLIFKRDIMNQPLTEGEQSLYIKMYKRVISDPQKYAIPVLKQSYYGPYANPDLKVAGIGFDKFSLAPLRPSLALEMGDKKMMELLKTMAQRQIGYVKYQSGSKFFIRKVLSIDKLATEKSLDLYHTDLLKLQITPSTEEKTETLIPTQKIKLILANLFDKGQASSSEAQALRDEFNSILREVQASNRSAVLSGLGFNANGEWDLSKLVSKISDQVRNQKLSTSILEGLEIDQQTGEFKAIESSAIYKQVIDYILGIVDKKLRKFNVNGGDFVLLAPSMLNKKLNYYKYTSKGTAECQCAITLTKEFTKLLNLADPETGSEIGTIERLNTLLGDPLFVKANKKALTVSFSRPPVDGLHSMGTAIVAKFMFPTGGNILILPEEYIQQAGIDFDYDKEKVLIPNLSEDGLVFTEDKEIDNALKALEDEYKEFRELHEAVVDHLSEAEDYEEYNEARNKFLGSDVYTKMFERIFGGFIGERDLYDALLAKSINYNNLKRRKDGMMGNRLLDVINKIMLLPEAYSELILPSNTETAKRLANMNAEDLKDEDGYAASTLPRAERVYDYLENLNVFKVFNEAAKLLGVFALDNTISQVLAQHDIQIPLKYAYKNDKPTRYINLIGLSQEERQEIVKDGRISLSSRTNIAGEINQHLRSEWISITVDAAKDPRFADLLISFDNVNVMSFMMYLGYPSDRIIDYLNTAPIRKLLSLKKTGLSLNEAFEVIIKNDFGVGVRMNESNVLGIDQDTLITGPIAKVLTPESRLSDPTELKKYKTLKLTKQEDRVAVSDSIRLIANFIAMTEHAEKLSNYKNLFKNDTNKISSLFDIISRRKNRENVLLDKMFTQKEIEAIEYDSVITASRNDEFVENIIEKISPLYSQTDVLNTLSSLYNIRKSSNSTTSAILAGVLAADFLTFNLFMFGLHTDIDGNEHTFYRYGKDLIVKKKNPDKTFSKVLLDRFLSLRNHPAYPAIVKEFSVFEVMQGEITPIRIKKNRIYGGTHGYNTQLNVPIDAPILVKENYQNQFKRLLSGDFDFESQEVNERLRNFVKDFFIAGFIQSGFNKSRLTYHEYAPVAFIQSFLQPGLDRFNNLNEQNRKLVLAGFRDQFLLNNSKYFKKSDMPKGQVQEYTYLGKYYGNEANNVAFIRQLDTPLIPETPESDLNPADFTNHSGGATGSDSIWDTTGREFGITNHIHYHAEDEKTPRGNTPIDREELKQADPFLIEANKTLGRTFPTSKEYVNNLLRRNYWQVKNSDAIFAISTITNNKVDGGTGWAVHMAIAMEKPVYVFDQEVKGWYTWNIDRFTSMVQIPTLTPNFAGIGTREINKSGREAIKDVYAKTFGKKAQRVEEAITSTSSDVIKDHSMFYKMPAKDNLTKRDTTTLELSEAGIRTGTTRSYPLGAIGDIITFEGRPQQYRITDIEELTEEKIHDVEWIKKWSQKEQWTTDYFGRIVNTKSTVRVGSFQTSYERVDAPSLANTVTTTSKPTGIVYNKEQVEAIEAAKDFLYNGDSNSYFLIEGKAGTGKSTIIREVLKEFKGKRMIAGALSHKAKGVIKDSIKKAGVKAEISTIAGMLGLKLNMETGEFAKDPENQFEPAISKADIIVIDEASMVNEQALELIFAEKSKRAKVIFLGDIGQLPPIRTLKNPYYTARPQLIGKISPVFDSKNKSILLERVRQGEQSPILPYADYFWDNSQASSVKDNPAPTESRKSLILDEGALMFVNNSKTVIDEAISLFKKAVADKNPNLIKFITYKNDTRRAINKFVHESVFGMDAKQFELGEIIIFNNSFDKIENATETQIVEMSPTQTDPGGFQYANIKIVVETEKGTAIETVPILLSDDRKKYQDYVSKLFQDAFAIKGQPEYKMKLTAAWEARNRYADVDYAYALTSHKSQGSTYDVTIVHEKDIMSVNATTARDKSQSIYTALTRPRNIAVVISSTKVDEIDIPNLSALNDKYNGTSNDVTNTSEGTPSSSIDIPGKPSIDINDKNGCR